MIRTLLAAAAMAGILVAPANAATIAETDTWTPSVGYGVGTHTLTFTVTNDQTTPILLWTSTYGYRQAPVTPVDVILSAGGTYTFAHNVTVTTGPGCSAFGQHLRTGGTGFGGVTCGYWLVGAGETRAFQTSSPSWYSSSIPWGAYWRAA